MPSVIQKLIDIFSKFPTIGPRTASRFVFYLVKMKDDRFNDFINTLSDLRKNIKICSFCFNPFEAQESGALCPICQNPMRNKSLLCVVEKEQDLISIEKTKKYNGLYFILNGAISGLREEDINKIRIKELEEKIKNNNFSEVIIATNSTAEGETTGLLVERRIKAIKNIKTTRLARGLPVGGELEYADEETLESAIEGRK